MKASLSHLPQEKRAELKAIATEIRQEVADVVMIVLFGSYARGDWKDESYVDQDVFYQYRSDLDILVTGDLDNAKAVCESIIAVLYPLYEGKAWVMGNE